MKYVFIDGGSNTGQGYEQISKLFTTDFEVHMFEPNPYCYEILLNKYPEKIINNKALWNKSCKRKLKIEYCPNEKQLTGGATNILEENFIKPDYILDEYISNEKIEVDCVSLVDYIKKNINISDYIVLKLDIEGAEFEVLDDLIENHLIEYINLIIIEWHEKMRSDNNKPREYYLDLFKKNNIRYIAWH